jgi:hypothetical protein
MQTKVNREVAAQTIQATLDKLMVEYVEDDAWTVQFGMTSDVDVDTASGNYKRENEVYTLTVRRKP